MKILCPNCGKSVAVNGLGRKRLNVAVAIVCNALQASSGNYRRATEIITDKTGIPVTSGFVHKRIKRAGLKLKDVIKGG